jgi:ATP-dependent Clp protease ATP-binding subunit ClpC
MARRRRDAGQSSEARIDDVEAAVRAAARVIAERWETDFPAPDDLVDDPDFRRSSQLLADPAVPFETVARLGRSTTAVIAAVAHRAVALRTDIPPEWIDWAYRRLKQAYGGELVVLLQAIEQHGEPPFLVRVLARGDDDWTTGWLLGVVTAFVERRVQRGERPTVADFDRFVRPSDEELVAAVVDELEGVLPSDTTDEFTQWREKRAQFAFFSTFGHTWEAPELPPLTTVGGRAGVVDGLEATLRRESGPRSALLIGEHGVGKSLVGAEVLRRLSDDGWFVFVAGAAEVQAGQTYIGQLEGRVQEIAERSARQSVVWVIPNFEEALWTGQHTRNPRGLLDALVPFVAAGDLRILGEIEPRAYELLIRRRPRVTALFESFRLEPLAREEAIAVATHWREQVGARISDQTIDDTYDLAEHYLASVAAPARLLRLLKATVVEEASSEIRTGHVIETLSKATGLPLHVVDPETPLDLEEVRRFFSGRIIGQADAVDCLVERISLIKANLTDPTRPLGVFLFIGPTGTGKTEIAKTLAEFLFGSPDRLVRLDMSEFQTEASFDRLLADSAANTDAATLMSSVRANPFSVVLLDEFEKAHRKVWNLFLQLFDDGRLTDQQGRVVDFRQCVVILTSNYGAAVDSREPLGFGASAGARFNPAQIERGLSRAFSPELLNRIDRVVIFRPFERDQIRALLQRELVQVLERRGFRNRPWAVEWDESALEFLAEKGFSAELGARPLKRAVERYLLAPLAAAIVSRSFPEGEQFLFITTRQNRIEVTFVDPDADDGELEPAATDGELRLESLVVGSHGGAEELHFLQTETARLRAVIEGDDWVGYKERDLEVMRSEGFWDTPDRFAVLARIEYVDRVQAAFRTAEKLAARLTRPGGNGRGSARVVELLAERLYLLDRACTGRNASTPVDAFVHLETSASDPAAAEFALRLRDMYEAWARRRGMRVQRLHSDSGYLLTLSGIGAYSILAAESGLHVFESPHDERSFDRAAVQVTVAPRAAAAPDVEPLELARQALAGLNVPAAVVRRYRERPSPLVRDSVRDSRTGRLDRVLAGDFDLMLEG